MKNINKKILITGGAGFIGANLCVALISRGYKVIVIDNLSSGKKENLHKDVKFFKIDINDKKVNNIFKKEKPNIVFHLAAQKSISKSIENPIADARINLLGLLNIFNNCVDNKVEKIIYTSSGGAIYSSPKKIPTKEGDLESPLSPYGVSKLAGEKYLESYHANFKIPFVSLRLSNVYGPLQNKDGETGVIATLLQKILSNSKFFEIYGDGSQTRDYVFVDDVVNALILSMQNNISGCFNIGTGRETNVNQLFKKIKELCDSKIIDKKNSLLNGGQKRSCLDCSKAKKILHWKPKFVLEEGLIKTINWFLKQK